MRFRKININKKFHKRLYIYQILNFLNFLIIEDFDFKFYFLFFLYNFVSYSHENKNTIINPIFDFSSFLILIRIYFNIFLTAISPKNK